LPALSTYRAWVNAFAFVAERAVVCSSIEKLTGPLTRKLTTCRVV